MSTLIQLETRSAQYCTIRCVVIIDWLHYFFTFNCCTRPSIGYGRRAQIHRFLSFFLCNNAIRFLYFECLWVYGCTMHAFAHSTMHMHCNCKMNPFSIIFFFFISICIFANRCGILFHFTIFPNFWKLRHTRMDDGILEHLLRT